MLIRRKSSTDDEYHHEDPLGVFGVITGLQRRGTEQQCVRCIHVRSIYYQFDGI